MLQFGQRLARLPTAEDTLVSLPRHSGFSRIDLLIIVAIVLVLGVILVPRVLATRHRSTEDQVRAQLRTLKAKETEYQRTHGSYTTDRAALAISDSGEVVLTILTATATGWSATARHQGSDVTCSLWVGSERMLRGQEGEPECQ
jgi:type II secretory pathway pseudopilin PulG